MSKFTVTTSGAVSAVALAAATACAVSINVAPASATTVLYGGGATFPEKAYRDIFNCYGDTSSGELRGNLAGGATTCNAATPHNGNVAVLYVGVGSGNGLNAFVHNVTSEYDVNSLSGATRTPDKPPVVGTSAYGQFYGTGNGTAWTPGNTTVTRFPHNSMTGSDDPMTTKQLYLLGNFTYQDTSWGHEVQFPTMVGAAALDYSQATVGAGNVAIAWNEKGKTVKGNDSHLYLSTTTWCGIWTGAITDWNNSEITTDNGNVSVTGNVSAPIKVQHRSDGSGTTFLFANAMIHQCGTQSNHTGNQTHPIPDNWWPAGTTVPNQVSDNSFFVKAKANVLAGNGTWPSNFTGNSGNGGVKAAVIGNPGSVGYNTTDFINLAGGLPDPTGPRAANLQTWASFNAGGTKKFTAPTILAITKIMGKKKPPSPGKLCTVDTSNPNKVPVAGSSFDGKCSHNPLNWGVAEPAPTDPNAYAIGGFTFMNLYGCYATQADKDALVSTTSGSEGLWYWWFTDTAVKTGLNSNGFAEVPNSWKSAIKKLLTTDTFTRPQSIAEAASANGGCKPFKGNLTVSGGA